MAQVSKVVFNQVFNNNQTVRDVNLKNVCWKDSSMINSFYNCQNLRNVYNIGPSVVNMQRSFFNCINMTAAPTIPNSVTDMATTFYNCQNLRTPANIPDSVTSIGSIYYQCFNLQSAPTISNSLIKGSYAFWYCNKMVDTPDLSNCTNLTDVYCMFAHCGIKNPPVIPNSVTNMASMFSGGNNISTTPVIPNTVTILSSTFSSCPNLKTAGDIPDSVVTMGAGFWCCSNLTSINSFGNSIEEMEACFYACSKLTSIPNLPKSVREMGMYPADNYTSSRGVFQNCTNLTGNIYIHSENIARCEQIFHNTSLTKNVYIPFRYETDVSEKLLAYKDRTNNIVYYSTENPGRYLNSYRNVVYYSNMVVMPRTVIMNNNKLWSYGSTNITLSRDSANDITYTWQAGNYTRTYNAFIAAGYDTTGSRNGVYLKDLNEL